jgi:hypothetical protein
MEALARKIKSMDHQIPYAIASEISMYLFSRAENLRSRASLIHDGPGLTGLCFGRIQPKRDV